MGNKEQFVDLHTHTYHSDGLIAPKNLVDLAKQKRIDTLSITDHNTLAAYRHFDWQNIDDVKVVVGCEFSANYHGKRVHILGYNIALDDEKMNAHLDKIRQVQVTKLKKYLQFFKEHDVSIPQEIVDNIFQQEFSASDAGFLNMVNIYHVEFPENKFFDFRLKVGKTHLFEQKTVDDIVKLIHNAGGKAILAHPGKYNIRNMDYLFYDMAQKGIDGVECFHPLHRKKEKEYFCRLAKENNLFVTAGSDAHTYFLKNVNKRGFASQCQDTHLRQQKFLDFLKQ